MLTSTRLIVRSLWYHLRIHGAVALGVAAATAVLTGALIVGDSVRQSLRDLALDQLGAIDEILVTDRFFRAELADELAATPTFQQHFQSATPVVLFPTGVVQSQSDMQLRAGQILVVGCDERFFQLGDEQIPAPDYDQIVINQPLADDLGVKAGDQVLVRLPDAADIPADSALAHKEGRSRTLAGLEVIAVVPAEGLGRFSVRPNQTEPRNAYLSLEQLQQTLDEDGRVNAMLISAGTETPPDEDASRQLAEALAPKLTDYGLRLEEARVGWEDGDTVRWPVDYWSITSSRMVFDQETNETLQAAANSLGGQPVSTYMANSIGVAGSDATPVPYSTVTGVNPSDSFPIKTIAGGSISAWGDDEVVLNQWTAEQLNAKTGDTIVVKYYAPETTHGESEELTASLKLRGVVPLTEPRDGFDGDVPPLYTTPATLYNDPFFTPTVEGITDEESIANWDPPFPYDSDLIEPRDDEYWDKHRTTPKAFVSMNTARQLWDSRFGLVTSYRVPRTAEQGEQAVTTTIETALRDAGNPGFVFTPVRRQALRASSGTTPFDGLFLALSFFIIAAALILVSLLFQLGVEQRAEEAGTMLAVGMTQRDVRRLWTREGLGVAAIGALLGAAIGVAYAWLMVVGLKSWWVGAIATPFLTLHVTAKSLALGYVLGVLACVATIALRLRSMQRLSIRRLLAGEAQEETVVSRRAHPVYTYVGLALLAAAIGLGLVAAQLPGGESQAGGFVGSGALLLLGLLLLIWNRLRGSATVAGAYSLAALASRNASRNPTRSTMVIGLMAVASFLIVAMSAFRLSPTLEGAGGFTLVGEASLPVFADLNDEEARYNLFADPDAVADAQVLPFRVKPGDDASCRNLYQSTRPRVLGVTDTMIQYYDTPREAPFQFAAAADLPEQPVGEAQNPWRLLAADPGPGKPAPMILDKNTAMYSLHLYGGVGQKFTIEYPDGQSVDFEVVALLSNSVLQGSVLIGENAFERLFPEVGGYQFFLAGRTGDEGDSEATELAAAFEEALSSQGLDMRSTRAVLRDLLNVQNTYLTTFQSLGLLGLLLGTFGLATVQLRSVFERRRELALMRAAGFTSRKLAQMVLQENIVLLVAGLATGALAALVAVLPYGLATGSDIPWKQLGVMLVAVMTTGLLTGLFAVRATLKAPLVAALRGE